MKRLRFLFVTIAIIFSCQDSSKKQRSAQESIKILVDESVAPMMYDQAYVFENVYSKAQLKLINKPEGKLLDFFLNDRARIAILPRTLTKEESKFYQNKKIRVRVSPFAMDALAFIGHESNIDSIITVGDILDVLRGKSKKNGSLIFDHPSSSTLRYFKSMAGIKNFPVQGVYALKSSAEVIRYVYENSNSIGVLGVSWMKQPDQNLEKIIKHLRVLAVKPLSAQGAADLAYKPTQNNIAAGLYPFIRSLYVINCQGGAGLDSGFLSFLMGERGQRILLKSGLVPDQIPPREVIIKK